MYGENPSVLQSAQYRHDGGNIINHKVWLLNWSNICVLRGQNYQPLFGTDCKPDCPKFQQSNVEPGSCLSFSLSGK
jgi:hypothetical protein